MRLGSLSGPVERRSVVGAFWLEDSRREDGRWISPAAVELFTERGKRALTFIVDDSVLSGALVPLPRRPGKQLLEWSEWLPLSSDPEPELPVSRPPGLPTFARTSTIAARSTDPHRPLIALLAVKPRHGFLTLRPCRAAVVALLAGLATAVAARSIGLSARTRMALLPMSTAAAFPVFSRFTLALLSALALRQPASAHAPRPPPAHEAAALAQAAAPTAASPEAHVPNPTHRRGFWILIGFYSLALLAWPVMSAGAVFAFDDPDANRLVAWYIAASIWLYPAFVATGFFWGYFNRNPSLLVLVAKTSVPLLSAIWFFLLPGIPMLARSLLLAPSVEEVVREREAFEARLDPIYAERAIAVRARDAEADAREAIRRGEVALIPYTPGSDDYIGIDGPPPLDAASSQRVISNSEYLTGIVTLLTEDESHPRARIGDRDGFDYSVYYSDTFKGFLDARREYMARFNATIAQHLRAAR